MIIGASIGAFIWLTWLSIVWVDVLLSRRSHYIDWKFGNIAVGFVVLTFVFGSGGALIEWIF